MKTIFDKIDPVYLNHAAQGIECTTGTCGHSAHQYTGVLFLIIAALITTIGVKALHARQ
jgi:hypothetical protein